MVEITNLYIAEKFMNDTKALIQSKQFWLAVIQAVAGIVMVFATAYPQVGWLIMAKSVVDIVLRLMTTQPIGRII